MWELLARVAEHVIERMGFAGPPDIVQDFEREG